MRYFIVIISFLQLFLFGKPFFSSLSFNILEAFSDALIIRFKLDDIDIICLAGFMQVLDSKFVRQWQSRLINIHPSYLPAFKGLNAQDQAIKAKASYSGCSVHYVSAKIDSGKIILQKKVKILKKDNTESLSKKILIEEHKVYPRALQMVAKTLLTRQQ